MNLGLDLRGPPNLPEWFCCQTQVEPMGFSFRALRRRQARLLRDRFNPDFFHLRRGPRVSRVQSEYKMQDQRIV